MTQIPGVLLTFLLIAFWAAGLGMGWYLRAEHEWDKKNR